MDFSGLSGSGEYSGVIRIDSYGLKICAFQAKVFEESVSRLNCSSSIFIRRFMYSDLASRLDNDGYFAESIGLEEVYDDLDRQYGITEYGQQKYSKSEMHWMGYIYRYWAYVYGKTSKQVFKYMKPSELRDLYFPYHSLDPAQAIERILESKGINDIDEIARGVEIVRRIRQKYQSTT